MGCDCGISAGKTKPGDSCIYCACKHIGLALASFRCHGLISGARQFALGELELARRHTAIDYPALGSSIAEVEEHIAARDDGPVSEALCRLTWICDEAAASKESGSYLAGVYASTPSMAKANPLAGELFLSVAWRLHGELGYARVNRCMLIGELTAAQYHLAALSEQLGSRILAIRKKMERREDTTEQEWLDLVVDADAVIAEAIANGASTDISWYIRR